MAIITVRAFLPAAGAATGREMAVGNSLGRGSWPALQALESMLTPPWCRIHGATTRTDEAVSQHLRELAAAEGDVPVGGRARVYAIERGLQRSGSVPCAHAHGQPTHPAACPRLHHLQPVCRPAPPGIGIQRADALLERQQALVDLRALQPRLLVVVVRVCAGGWVGRGRREAGYRGHRVCSRLQTGQLPSHAAQHQCARQGAARNLRGLPAAPPNPAPAPRSLPARSMNDSLPTVLAGSVSVRSAKHRMECELQHGGGQGRPGQLHRKRMCSHAPRPAPHCFAGAGSSPRRLVVGAGAAGAARSRGVVAELLQHIQATDAHLAQPHHLQQGVSTRAQPEHWRRRLAWR